MATQSQFVTDDDINTFKNSIKQWQELRKEVELALEAGITPKMTIREIDDKIAATVRVIEAYTGTTYRP